jgi:hypothetical protein
MCFSGGSGWKTCVFWAEVAEKCAFIRVLIFPVKMTRDPIKMTSHPRDKIWFYVIDWISICGFELNLSDLIPIADWFSNILIVMLLSDTTPYQRLGFTHRRLKKSSLSFKIPSPYHQGSAHWHKWSSNDRIHPIIEISSNHQILSKLYQVTC